MLLQVPRPPAENDRRIVLCVRRYVVLLVHEALVAEGALLLPEGQQDIQDLIVARGHAEEIDKPYGVFEVEPVHDPAHVAASDCYEGPGLLSDQLGED